MFSTEECFCKSGALDTENVSTFSELITEKRCAIFQALKQTGDVVRP